MRDRASIQELDDSIRASIDRARSLSSEHPAAARTLQRIVALLWSAHDELEGVATPARRPVALVAGQRR